MKRPPRVKDSEVFTGYVTKDVLRRGIRRMHLIRYPTSDTGRTYPAYEKFPSEQFKREGIEWHRTIVSALQYANKVHVRELEKAEARLAYLRQIKFVDACGNALPMPDSPAMSKEQRATLGGEARAKTLSASQRSEIASKAAQARWYQKRSKPSAGEKE